MRRICIGILSQSHLLSAGLLTLPQYCNEHELAFVPLEPHNIESQIKKHRLTTVIADPLSPGLCRLMELKNNGLLHGTRVIALISGLLPETMASRFDAQISIYDTHNAIIHTLLDASSASAEHTDDSRTDLTPREKEIVKGIVKGLSNKEIASEINVSVNTVMTHRRNIASKLQIHSPAGLTIYAIVSKLVSIDEIRHTID